MILQERNFITLLDASIQPGKTPILEDPSYPDIFRLAELHCVTGLLYPALKQCLPLGDPFLSKMKRQSFAAATRESVQGKELSQIFAACEEAELPILPLKGCVIKSLYPYPELRFMSDADLVIPENRREKMRSLMEGLGFRFHKVDAGDTDVYVSPLHLNYEIHLSLADEGFSQKTQEFVGHITDYAHPKEGFRFVMELPREEHYLYILCHFIKHFIYGGVGVRQLTDLFICYKEWELDREKLDTLLRKFDLVQFHDRIQGLWDFWFTNASPDAVTEELSAYILHSGVFGTEEQRSTDRLLSVGQEKSYVLTRLFPPYKVMKGYFPVLKKLPFLLPFLWVWRAIRAILFRRDKLRTEFKVMSATENDALERRRRFYHQCGLSVYRELSE